MAGSAVFRYLAEAGFAPVLVNRDRGSSWRNIAGGRPAFSLPALADIANHNLEIFRDLQKHSNIDFLQIRYVNFAHDEATYKSLDAARAWSKAYMVDPKDFRKEISPYMNPGLNLYVAAQVTEDCWQATPGKTVNAVRLIGRSHAAAYSRTPSWWMYAKWAESTKYWCVTVPVTTLSSARRCL